MQIDYLFHNFGGWGLEIYLLVLSHSNAAILGQGRDAKHNQTEKYCSSSFPEIFKHDTPFCSGALKVFLGGINAKIFGLDDASPRLRLYQI